MVSVGVGVGCGGLERSDFMRGGTGSRTLAGTKPCIPTDTRTRKDARSLSASAVCCACHAPPPLPRTGHTAWLLCRVGFGVSPGSSMVGSLVAVAVPSGVTNFYKPTAYARPSVVSNREVMWGSGLHRPTTLRPCQLLAEGVRWPQPLRDGACPSLALGVDGPGS